MNAQHPLAPWPRSARTRDDIEYWIRPITPDDARREREFIAAMSPQSRYQRFLHVLGEPSADMIEHLVNVDGHRHVALVATIGAAEGELFIGVARYAADTEGTDCEFALAVADAWQCRGIGTTLAPLLFEYAATQGFRRIYGYVLASNDRMLELCRHLGLTIDSRLVDTGLVRAWRSLT